MLAASILTPVPELGQDSQKLLREVKSWDEARVATWLQSVNSAPYAPVFISNNINGDALLECDQQALKELGITKVGDRVRLHVAIKNLRNNCFNANKKTSIATILTLDPAPASPIGSLSSPRIATARTPTSASVPSKLSNISASPSKARGPNGELIESPLRSANGMSSLLSNCVKFIGEEGQTRIVNIGDCGDTTKILEKALKKFGLTESITLDPSDVVENYRVFITAEVGPARQLSDEELFGICQDPSRPERERLILKKKDTAPSIMEFQQAQKIAREQQLLLKDQAIANNMGKLKKIGGFFGETPNHIRAGSTSNATSPLDSPGLSQSRGPKARIKEFFGARPPSELISSNLQEYFPEASTLILEKTVRNSIRRSQRMSVASRGGAGPPPNRRQSTASLYSVSSIKSVAPPVPSVGDAWINATSLARKSRPPSLYRSPSIMSRGETLRSSRRSVRSLAMHDKNGEETDDASVRSVSPSTSRTSMAKERDDGPFTEEDSGADTEFAESETDDGEFVLPDYLREKLALTEAEDENTRTLRALSLAMPNGLPGGPISPGLTDDDTGPSSWIKGTLIGQGSFGSVVLGMNALTGELMAVKQVDLPRNVHGDRELHSRKTEMLDALQREITLLRDLQHDNIVQYLGSNSDETHLNIFLEYVPGGSVTEMLTKYGAFKEPLVRQFVRQILRGLTYLHEREIIHRDIKGGNILVDNKGVIKISDFGISKKVDSSMLSIHQPAMSTNNSSTSSGNKADNRPPSLQGSVFWMAPEVVKQTQYTRKADIWSLGCLIVEMLTGKHPYPDLNQMQAIFKIGGSDSAPQIPSGISGDARDFLRRTFMLDFQDRPCAADLLAHPFCHASVA